MSHIAIIFLLYYISIIGCYGHNEPVQICVVGSGYNNRDGTYEWMYWDSTLNGSVFFAQSSSRYLYPITWSANTYRWMISNTPGSNSQFAAYATHYNPPPFQIEDSFKQWKSWNNSAQIFQSRYSMTASDCTNVCVKNSNHTFLNGIYIWNHFSQVYNSSVYWCSECDYNKGVYLTGYVWQDTGDYGWRIGSNVTGPFSWCGCNVGMNLGANFIFTLDICINSWQWVNGNTEQWESDPYMTVDNCPHTHSPTYMPTNNPTISPTTVIPTTKDPSKSPTAAPHTQSPTYIPTNNPTVTPTTATPTTKVPSKAPTTANPTPAPTDCVSNVNEELDTTTFSGWTTNTSTGNILPYMFKVINYTDRCYAINPCIKIVGNSDEPDPCDTYIERILDSSGWNDLTIHIEVSTDSLDGNNNEYGFVEIICDTNNTIQRTEFNHAVWSPKHYSGCFYVYTSQCDTITLRIGGWISGTGDEIYVTQILLQYSTSAPSVNPTQSPTNIPTINPSQLPSIQPSLNPTEMPSIQPSLMPTNFPTTLMPTIIGDGRVDAVTTRIMITGTIAKDEIENNHNESAISLVLYAVVGGWLLILLIIGIICYRRKRANGGYIQDTNIDKNKMSVNKMNVNKLQVGLQKRDTVMSVSMDTMDDIRTPTGYENNILNMKSVEMNDLSKSNVLNNDLIDNGDILTIGGNEEGETNRNSENDSETPMGDDNVPDDDFIVHSDDEETLQ